MEDLQPRAPSRSRGPEALSLLVKQKAQSSLEACKALVSHKLTDSAASRLYYALFQAGVHALDQQGRDPRKLDGHASEGRWSHTFFRNNASLCRGNREDRRLFRAAYDLRVTADYSDVPVEAHQIGKLMPAVEGFLQETCT